MGGKEWREEKLSPRSGSRRPGRAVPGRCQGAAGPLIKRWRRGAGDTGAMRGGSWLCWAAADRASREGGGLGDGLGSVGAVTVPLTQPFASFSQRWRCDF